MQASFLHSAYPAHGARAPDYLEAHDYPWLRGLIEAFRRFEGRPRRELELHLREPLPCPSPKPKRDAATRILHRLCRGDAEPPVRPRDLRAALFSAAAAAAGARPETLRATVAQTFDLTAGELDGWLFADLPSERRVAAVPEELSPAELAARTNFHIAQGVLRGATEVLLELKGNARAVVRVARLQGLIVVAEPAPRGADYDVRLAISGPLVLFRKTIVYGRALASLLYALPWCERFVLRARCGEAPRPFDVEIRTGDPLFPGDEPPRYDSRVEARFARDFARAAPDWDVIREPEPIAVDDRLIFPDFALEHRRDRRRWLLEIVGFWTPAYLDHKLHDLRRARAPNLIVCVDERRNCSAGDLPAHGRLLHYRNAIDPVQVLAILEGKAR